MAVGVHFVGFFFGCSFQFCLALIYLVCWMFILLWFYMRYLSLFALRAAIISFAAGDGLPRLRKIVCLAVIHSLGVWLCYFSSALKPLH
jgi:hypothetical protein